MLSRIRESKYLRIAYGRNRKMFQLGRANTINGLRARLNLHERLVQHAKSQLQRMGGQERVIL
jgi:hypothetical protein